MILYACSCAIAAAARDDDAACNGECTICAPRALMLDFADTGRRVPEEDARGDGTSGLRAACAAVPDGSRLMRREGGAGGVLRSAWVSSEDAGERVTPLAAGNALPALAAGGCICRAWRSIAARKGITHP